MPQEFNGLCESVIEALIEWPSLMASLQASKGEINKAGIIENALGRYCQQGRIVLMEYRNIDYAIVRSDSVLSRHHLTVDALFECKFNYSRQTEEFRRRLHGHPQGEHNWRSSAFEQVSEYRINLNQREPMPRTFVLYLIASPWVNIFPQRQVDRDTGFSYFCNSREAASTSDHTSSENIARLINEINLDGEIISVHSQHNGVLDYNNNGIIGGCFLRCYLFEFTSQEPYNDPQRP